MAGYVARYRWIILPICLIAGIALAVGVHNRGSPARLLITVDHGTLPADGYAQALAHVQSSDGRELRSVAWQIEDGRSLAEFEQYAAVARVSGQN